MPPGTCDNPRRMCLPNHPSHNRSCICKQAAAAVAAGYGSAALPNGGASQQPAGPRAAGGGAVARPGPGGGGMGPMAPRGVAAVEKQQGQKDPFANLFS